MSLNAQEIGRLVSFARSVIRDVDNAVAVSGGGANGTLLFADLTAVNAAKHTRNGIAVLVNRAYAEMPELGKPPALAES